MTVRSAIKDQPFYSIGRDLDFTIGLNPIRPYEIWPEHGKIYTTRDCIPLFLTEKTTKIASIKVPKTARTSRVTPFSKKAEKILVLDIQNIRDFETWNEVKFCEKAVALNPVSLQFIKRNVEELSLKSVSKNGLNIKYIRKEFITEKIEDVAVKQNRSAFRYVRDQTMFMWNLLGSYQVHPWQ